MRIGAFSVRLDEPVGKPKTVNGLKVTPRMCEALRQAGEAKESRAAWEKRYNEYRKELESLLPQPSAGPVIFGVDGYEAIYDIPVVRYVDVRALFERCQDDATLLDAFWRLVKIGVQDMDSGLFPPEISAAVVVASSADAPRLTIRNAPRAK